MWRTRSATREEVGRGGQDGGPKRFLLRAAAAVAALRARGGRRNTLEKTASWRDLSAELPTRAKAVRHAGRAHFVVIYC
jgi:hypothetical protein